MSLEQRLRAGDIVVATSSGSVQVVGKSARLANEWEGTFGAFCAVVRTGPEADSSYVGYFLQSADIRKVWSNAARGTNINNLKRSDVQRTHIPLPPLPEQRRIVAEIEKQLTRLDAAVGGLERARAGLRRYRASVLHAAVEGRLVPTEASLARAEGREFESASQQLSQLGISTLVDVSPTTEGWAACELGRLARVETGATPLRSRPEYYGGDIPWVTSGALNLPFVDAAQEHITELAIRETNAKIFPPGTMLVAMYGEGKTRGKSAEMRIAAATNQACAAVLFNDATQPMKPYVQQFLRKHYDDLRRQSAGGVQPNLNLSIVRSIVIPVPPTAEQHRIVAEVERRLSIAEKLEAAVADGLRRATALRRSILKRAFEGRLVPQDPDDEPAEVLLERIRAERAAQASDGRTPRRRRRARA